MDFPSTSDQADNSGTDQPWLVRKDWASGDLCYSGWRDLSNFVLLGFGVCVLLISLGFALSLPRMVRESGYSGAIPFLITALVGSALTTRGVRLTVRLLRYGCSRFHLASVPVPLGGPLRGELRMSTPIPAGERLRLKIECRSFTTQEMRRTDGTIDWDVHSLAVWEDEETVTSDGSGIVPVSFVVPADTRATRFRPAKWRTKNQPAADIWWIEWWLIAEDPTGSTARYHAEFELPVFRVAETTLQVAETESIRTARKQELESYRPGPDFKIRITPGQDGGTEFFFPPVRRGANATGQTVVFLSTVAVLAAVCATAPLWIVAIWGTIDILFFGWILRLWFAPEQVVIGNGNITVTAGLFAKKRSMPTAEVTSIHAAKQGYTLYNNIRIVGSGWHVLQVGDGIRENRDAEWLALQMSIAAGVKPASSIPMNSNLEQEQIMGALVNEMLMKTGARPFAAPTDGGLVRPVHQDRIQ